MSKVDALRAMREAKYARLQAGADVRPGAGAKPAPAAKPAATAKPAAAKPIPAAAAPVASGDACGHKSMNGRACTRQAGHPQKSHRYS